MPYPPRGKTGVGDRLVGGVDSLGIDGTVDFLEPADQGFVAKHGRPRGVYVSIDNLAAVHSDHDVDPAAGMPYWAIVPSSFHSVR